jgi:hypothetical protein
MAMALAKSTVAMLLPISDPTRAPEFGVAL